MRPATGVVPSPWIVALPTPTRTHIGGSAGSPVNGAWPGANRALYLPFSLPVTMRMVSMSVFATSISGTYDLGLYDETLAVQLGHLGSTTVATGLNTWTPATPVLLEAGRNYYAAMSCSNTTANFIRVNPSAGAMGVGGCAQEATAHPLPTTPTGAVVASAFFPIISLVLY